MDYKKRHMTNEEILEEIARCDGIIKKSKNWKCVNDFTKRRNRLKKMYYAKMKKKG